MPNKKKNQKYEDSPWIKENVLDNCCIEHVKEAMNYLRSMDNLLGRLQGEFKDWREGQLTDCGFSYQLGSTEQSLCRMILGLEGIFLKPYKKRLK